MTLNLRLISALLIGSALPAAAPVDGFTIVAKYPHSTQSYTEGLFYRDGLFYEGTGMNGHSALVVIQPATRKRLQGIDLPPQYFGEGIVDWGPNI